MKRICIALSIIFALSVTLLSAAGQTEQTTDSPVIIRVADNMPGSSPPGNGMDRLSVSTPQFMIIRLCLTLIQGN